MTLATPPPPGLLFWPAQWAWITQALQSIDAKQQAHAAVLAAIHTSLEHLMTQSDDLTAAVSANTAATHALTSTLAELKTAADAEIASVQTLIDLLAGGPALDPAVTQAIADVQANTAELEAASASAASETAALEADDASVPTP